MKCMLKRYLAVALLLASMSGGVAAHAVTKGWEPVKVEKAEAKSVLRDTDIEIKVANGTLIVSAGRTVQIKVFTILGRLVNADTLPAGRSQLALPAHGVYIIKVGDLTCKVAV